VNLIANHADGSERIAARPHREYVYAPTFVVILRIGSVNGGKGRAIDGLIFHVRDYADDRTHWRIRFRFASVGRKKLERRKHADRFPNWIFIGEELPREGLIDNRNPGRGLGVVVREKSAVAEPGGNRGQVAWR